MASFGRNLYFGTAIDLNKSHIPLNLSQGVSLDDHFLAKHYLQICHKIILLKNVFSLYFITLSAAESLQTGQVKLFVK